MMTGDLKRLGEDSGPSPISRTLLSFLFALILAGPLCGQEVFENADFSDGTTHWHGDGKPAGDSTDFTSDSSGAKGIQIDLHSGGWTKITQEIHEDKAPRQRDLVLTIVYQTSPDFKLSTRAEDYANLGPTLGFGGASLSLQPGQVLAFVDVPPANRASSTMSGGYQNITIYMDHVTSAPFVPSTDASPQTLTVQFHPPERLPDINPVFCLAFPPGTGSITLLKISLAPPDSAHSGSP